MLVKAATGLNKLRQRQNCCHFTDDIFKCIFLNENVWILFKISLKFVPKIWVNNIPALVQMMAWCRLGNRPLSEPMMVGLLMHIYIYVTWPQCVKRKLSSWLTVWFQWVWLPRVDSPYNSYRSTIQGKTYHKISNIRCTKSQNWNASRLVLQLSLSNPLKPGVKWRMKM